LAAAEYKVVVDKKFKKRLAKKTPEQQGAVLKCLKLLADDYNHKGLRCSKLGGTKDVYYARASRGSRVTFHWEDGDMVLRNHCKHDILSQP